MTKQCPHCFIVMDETKIGHVCGNPPPEEPRQPAKEYLGDGVYAMFDGYQIWLQTDRGTETHEIALDPSTWVALTRYAQRAFNGEKNGK